MGAGLEDGAVADDPDGRAAIGATLPGEAPAGGPCAAFEDAGQGEVGGGEASEMNEACRDLLRQHGFRFDGPLAHNELWIGPPLTRS